MSMKKPTIMYAGVKAKIDYMLVLGPISPKSILAVLTDIGGARKEIQFCIQIGLEKGWWHLGKEMNLVAGPFDWGKQRKDD